MSDHLAIGGVSLSLKALLEDRMEFADPALSASQKVTITISAPDVTHTGITGPRLNMFLYHLSENGSLKNQQIPGHGHPGDYGRPPLSLNLHYLITTYSASELNDVLAQRVLGDAMRVFHDFAVIPDSLMRVRTPGSPVLDTSLLGEFERIKITLQPMGLEEIAKIWTAMPEVSLRSAVAYEISVVQIESRRRRSATLPVQQQRVLALPLLTPHITAVFRDPPLGGFESPVAEPGETVKLRGVNFGGAAKRVTLRGADMPIVSRRDDEIVVTVPVTVPAGAHPVQVVEDIIFGVTPGQPLEPHAGFHSNVAALLVIPKLTGVVPPAAAAGATVTVSVTPSVEAKQEVEVLLNDRVLPIVPMAPGAPPSPTVQFILPAAPAVPIPPGSPLMRLRVDGAESRLTMDPVTRMYNGPTYSVL